MANATGRVFVEEEIALTLAVTVPAEPAEAEPVPDRLGLPVRRMTLAAIAGAILGFVVATHHTGPEAGSVWIVDALLVMTGFAVISSLAAALTGIRPD
jgi:hypothetical protein